MPKFTTKFNNKISFAEKTKEATEILSTASLKDLKGFLPSGADAENDPDLLHIVFNLAVVNQANLNGDAITTPTALAIAKNWRMKQLNIEHDREKIVGVITGAGFSSFPDNKILSESEVRELNTPFNIVASAIVWRVAGDIADILEESSEDGECDDISASWELGFDDYAISVGSDQINESRMVFESTERTYLEGFLAANGGSGSYQGKKVSRVIIGDVIPLGAGLTTSPAAAVKGLVLGCFDEVKAEVIAKVEEIPVFIEEIAASEKNIKKSENKISQIEIVNVKTNSMKYENLEQIKAHLEVEASAVDPRAVFDFLVNKIADNGVIFDQVKADKETAEAAALEKDAKISEIVADFEKVKTELEEIKVATAEKEKQQRNDARIDSLDKKYNLNPKKVKHILAQVKDLSDEEFATWLEGEEEFLVPHLKTATSVASVEDKAIEALDKSTASVDIPNAQGSPEKQDEKPWGLDKNDIKLQFKTK